MTWPASINCLLHAAMTHVPFNAVFHHNQLQISGRAAAWPRSLCFMVYAATPADFLQAPAFGLLGKQIVSTLPDTSCNNCHAFRACTHTTLRLHRMLLCVHDTDLERLTYLPAHACASHIIESLHAHADLCWYIWSSQELQEVLIPPRCSAWLVTDETRVTTKHGEEF